MGFELMELGTGVGPAEDDAWNEASGPALDELDWVWMSWTGLGLRPRCQSAEFHGSC